jgi:hypothetical protein
MNDDIEQQPQQQEPEAKPKTGGFSSMMNVLPSIVAASQPSMKQGYSDQIHFKKKFIYSVGGILRALIIVSFGVFFPEKKGSSKFDDFCSHFKS